MNPSDQPAPTDPPSNVPINPTPNVPPAADPFAPGAPPPPPQSEPPPMTAPGYSGVPGIPTPEEKNWALATHMSALIWLVSLPGVLGPLVVWLIKKDTMPFVNEHGKEAINFHLTQLFVIIALTVIGTITCGVGFLVTVPLMIIDAVFAAVMAIIAGLKAGNGEYYRYPLSWRIIK